MEQKSIFSMKAKMSIAFSSIAVLLISLFGFINYAKEKSNLLSSQLHEFSLETTIASVKVDAWINQRKTALESCKDVIEGGANIEDILAVGRNKNPFLKGNLDYGISNFYLGTKDSIFITGSDWLSPPEYDPTQRPWYLSVAEQNKTILTDYYMDATSGDLGISIASPIYNENSDIIAVLGVDVSLNQIVELVNETSHDENILIALIDEKGVTISHTAETLIGKNVLELKDDNGGIFMKSVVEDKTGNKSYIFNGVRKTMVYREIPSLNWVVVLFIPDDVIYAPLVALRTQTILFVIVTLLIFIMFVYFVSHMFVKRIMKVSESLKDISQGDGDLTQLIEVTSRDELTHLTSNFNNFVTLMRDMVSKIKGSVDSTMDTKDSLVSNTEETAASIAQISANMNSMESQIRRLDDSITNSSTSVNSITGSITDFNLIREEQSAIVDETTSSITQMISSLKQVAQISLEKKEAASQLTDTSRKGSEQLETLSSDFDEKVVTKLGNIEEMTDIIRGIASQINLLSMNAAIEAAHAGDSGKGFAVVADEIRKLAESSSSSVQTIDVVIKEIRVGVDGTVTNTRELSEIFSSMDRVVSEFTSALNQIANNTNELMTGSQEINNTAQRLNKITSNIKKSADSMKSGTVTLGSEMTTIQDVSRSVLGGIQEAVIGAEEIVTAMNQATTLSGNLARNSEELKTEVDRFRT